MTLIEGVGDEVIQFFGVLIVLLLGLVAWWSTGIRDLPQIRTVFILERRSLRQQTNLVSQHVSGVDNSQGDQSACHQRHLSTTRTVNNKRNGSVNSNIPSSIPPEGASNTESSSRSQGSSNVNLSEGVQSDTCINNKRNCSVDNNIPSSITPEGASNNDSSSRSEDVSNVNSREENDVSEIETAENKNDQNAKEPAGDNIRIRLKYLNDDQKLVEGRLQELLGDFKRRHFSMELSAQKLVRLIFNGQVLQRDDQTLQGCGLYDNCVVHCLVHAQQNSQRSNSQHINSPPPDWNLGGLLYTCLSVLLGLAWICRYNYSHLFTLTTTTALVGLTGMFIVSAIGLYMPEQVIPNN